MEDNSFIKFFGDKKSLLISELGYLKIELESLEKLLDSFVKIKLKIEDIIPIVGSHHVDFLLDEYSRDVKNIPVVKNDIYEKQRLIQNIQQQINII